MIKNILIDGKEVKVNSSSRWFFIYKQQFGHDILLDVMPFMEGLAVLLAEQEDDGSGTIKTDMGVFSLDEITRAFSSFSMLEMTTLYEVIWALAYNADETIGPPEEWINRFDRIELDTVFPAVIEVLADSCLSEKKRAAVSRSLKKLTPTAKKKTTATKKTSQ